MAACVSAGRTRKLCNVVFQALQAFLKLSDLPEQISLLSLALVLGLSLLAPSEQLTGALQQLLPPLAHLDGVNGVVSGELLERLSATGRLHGEPGLELWTVGRALDHRWGPLSGVVLRLRG